MEPCHAIIEEAIFLRRLRDKISRFFTIQFGIFTPSPNKTKQIFCEPDQVSFLKNRDQFFVHFIFCRAASFPSFASNVQLLRLYCTGTVKLIHCFFNLLPGPTSYNSMSLQQKDGDRNSNLALRPNLLYFFG